MTSDRSEVRGVVQAIGALPDIAVTRSGPTPDGWSIDCLMDLTPAGERSLSIIGYVVDCRVPDVSMDIGGQHGGQGDRACFSLRGSTPTAIPVAFEIDFGREAIAAQERRN